MWLLRAKDQTLIEFSNDEAIHQRYAILSHTWTEGEVTFQDIHDLGVARHKRGYAKIENACRQALQDGLEYVWVDTCCINKESSAELSESINSMFRWYEKSTRCYVYLEDVAPIGDGDHLDYPDWILHVISNCRWMTRGWTLQELIASRVIDFFADDWTFIGAKHTLIQELEMITTVPAYVLEDPSYLPTISVAKKMSWAANRVTTRLEDRAYSLLGLFGVSIPLLYGEGSNAFQRLQEAIIRVSTDHSIFAWKNSSSSEVGLLASSPSDFGQCGKVVRHVDQMHDAYELTNAGLRINLPLVQWNSITYAVLDCRYEDDFSGLLALPLEIIDTTAYSGSNTQTTVARPLRSTERPLKVFSFRDLGDCNGSDRATMLLVGYYNHWGTIMGHGIKFWLQLDGRCMQDLVLVESPSKHQWNPRTNVLSWTGTLMPQTTYNAVFVFRHQKHEDAIERPGSCRNCQRALPQEDNFGLWRLTTGPSGSQLIRSSREAILTATDDERRADLLYCSHCRHEPQTEARQRPHLRLDIRAIVGQHLAHECFFKASWSPSRTSARNDEEIKIAHDELWERHIVSWDSTDQDYDVKVEVCRKVVMRIPVYVISIGHVYGGAN